jgi:large subunit ribosomal protein L23
MKTLPKKIIGSVDERKNDLKKYSLSQILISPVISEKSTMVSEKNNQIVFKVLRSATKPEIKAAVEFMFKVDVINVSTAIQKGKIKRFGKSVGRRDHVKKAYISLKQGSEINFSQEATAQ